MDDEDTFPRRPIRRRSSPDVDASSIALFQDTLQTLFGLLTSTMILAKPNLAHTAISKFLRHRPETRIVTTNYDGCMDEALLAAGHNLEGTIGTTQPGSDVDNIQLIKMHGSINWSYCDSCQDVKAFDLSSLKGAFENDSLSYAVIGICRTCGGQRRPLLVPPLSFKFMTFPNLVSLWNSARRAIESSAVIIAVGYSLSEADTYITQMLSRSMALCPNQVLIVCDTDLSLVRTLRKRFSARIEAFDDRRILRVGGSCEHTLPKLLDSLVSESEAQPGHVPATPSATMRLD